jgi:putative multiple sugar transport system permease protein
MQNAYVIILAVGMLLCILCSGSIDLSVGSIVAFIGALVGELVVVKGINIWVSILIALVVGVLIGIWQGFWIAYMRIPAFIVTLAGMLIFRGLTLKVLNGMTISPFPEEFNFISSGFLPNISAGKLNITAILFGVIASLVYIYLAISKRVKKQKRNLETSSFTWFIIQMIAIVGAIMLFCVWLALYKGIPVLLVIITLLVVIYAFFSSRTVPGRYLYAMGGNEKAALLSGINTNKALFLVFINMSVLAALAGVVFTSRLQAATPTAGVNFELDAIASCFIGGASATGGVGTIVGAVIGALVMGVLNNGMSIMGVGSDVTQTIKGLVLLAAVIFDVVSKKRASKV